PATTGIQNASAIRAAATMAMTATTTAAISIAVSPGATTGTGGTSRFCPWLRAASAGRSRLRGASVERAVLAGSVLIGLRLIRGLFHRLAGRLHILAGAFDRIAAGKRHQYRRQQREGKGLHAHSFVQGFRKIAKRDPGSYAVAGIVPATTCHESSG